LSKLIKSTEEKVKKITGCTSKHEAHLDELEQYSRLKCIILHGCNLYADITSNRQLTSDLVNVLNNQLYP